MGKVRIALLTLLVLIALIGGWLLWSIYASSLPRDQQGQLPEPATTRADGPPNVVLIVADDLGFEGVSVYGSKRYRTPHIDALAARGVRFTNAHVSASVCSPSRAGLLTGRNGVGFGYEFNPGDQQDEETRGWGLPRNVPTLAERLKQRGYATAAIGKWHLGGAEGMKPQQRGFDEFFGVMEGALSLIHI